MFRIFCIILLMMGMGLSGCGIGNAAADTEAPPDTAVSEQEDSQMQQPDPAWEETTLKIQAGEYEWSASFEENQSAEEFAELLAQGKLTVEMEDYGGFEKVGPLGTTLTRSDSSITTEPGDVILYQGNQITIYYGTNTWNFTRLARIEDPGDLQEKLGEGTVSVTFSLE